MPRYTRGMLQTWAGYVCVEILSSTMNFGGNGSMARSTYNLSRLPDFLIIGAMKAGTTTLWGDLRLQPEIFLPEEKEPGDLKNDAVLRADGMRNYARLFSGALSNQLCGEASTYYTMLPDISGVPERAAEVCGRKLKIIYVVRNPITRALSHHRHSFIGGDMPADINEAVVKDPRLINYSKYAMQLQPWLDVFGPQNIYVMKMEDYIAQRSTKMRELCEFLGIKIDVRVLEHPQKALNTKDDLVRLGRFAKQISENTFYRRTLRWVLPLSLRQKMVKRLGRVPGGYSGKPTCRTLQLIVNGVRDDCLRLAQIAGVSASWDLDMTVSELSASFHAYLPKNLIEHG